MNSNFERMKTQKKNILQKSKSKLNHFIGLKTTILNFRGWKQSNSFSFCHYSLIWAWQPSIG